jgi:hypothetical protein
MEKPIKPVLDGFPDWVIDREFPLIIGLMVLIFVAWGAYPMLMR